MVNPRAGRGETAVGDVVLRVLSKLAGSSLVAIAHTTEARIAHVHGIHVNLVPGSSSGINAQASTRRLLAEGVTGILGVGGDGTLCDIASVLCTAQSSAWLLGIGVGSSNVGPLVGVPGSEVDGLDIEDLEEVAVHAIEARQGEESVGLAFHDVAVSNTYFGTRDGQRVDLDASAALSGNDRATTPLPVCGARTWIGKNGRKVVENRDRRIKQIVASPINNAGAYAGMAVSGLMCWGPYTGQDAVVTAASAVMIRTRLTPEDIRDAEPMHLIQISFGVDDQIELGGFESNAALVMDGNPMCRLEASETIALRMRPSAVRILRSRQRSSRGLA